MKCATCQHDNDASAQFCTDCGNALFRTCGSCQARNPPKARFGGACGANLQARPGEAPAAATSGVFASRAAITGERKLITVMFADIVDSTQLIEVLEPDEAAARLQAIVVAM